MAIFVRPEEIPKDSKIPPDHTMVTISEFLGEVLNKLFIFRSSPGFRFLIPRPLGLSQNHHRSKSGMLPRRWAFIIQLDWTRPSPSGHKNRSSSKSKNLPTKFRMRSDSPQSHLSLPMLGFLRSVCKLGFWAILRFFDPIISEPPNVSYRGIWWGCKIV